MKDKNNAEMQTVIGPSVKVEGDFNGDGDLIIEGQFTGSIKTKSNIQIGKEAVINASIEATNADISGSVIGDIITHDKIRLSSTANLKGNINCQSIQIEQGALFNGQCQMKHIDNEASTKSD